MRLSALLPLAGFLIVAGLLAIGLTRDPSQVKTQMIDRPVPKFNLQSLHDPNVVYTQDQLKGRVSVVNVFGSWCAPCAIEHPLWTQLPREREFALVGVNWRDERARGQGWLKRLGDPYDAVLFDELSLLAIGLGVTGAPETFIVDLSGTVRFKHAGIVTQPIWDETFAPLIETLNTVEGSR